MCNPSKMQNKHPFFGCCPSSVVLPSPPGPTGPTGPRGPAGPQGGALPAGYSYSDYLFYDGSEWRTGERNVHLGGHAGEIRQQSGAVAVGSFAGESDQGFKAVAVGYYAGQVNQPPQSIAIGEAAGQTHDIVDGSGNIAIGLEAGNTDQFTEAIAIGVQAGRSSQGANAIAIGARAGFFNQSPSSIVINASGTELNAAVAGCFIDPVRELQTPADVADGLRPVLYNSTTHELVHTGDVVATSGGIAFGSEVFELTSTAYTAIGESSSFTVATTAGQQLLITLTMQIVPDAGITAAYMSVSITGEAEIPFVFTPTNDARAVGTTSRSFLATASVVIPEIQADVYTIQPLARASVPNISITNVSVAAQALG
jgi:hypothetical protein